MRHSVETEAVSKLEAEVYTEETGSVTEAIQKRHDRAYNEATAQCRC